MQSNINHLQKAFTVASVADVAGTKQCVNCKTQSARWDSLYCSDNCRREFLAIGIRQERARRASMEGK